MLIDLNNVEDDAPPRDYTALNHSAAAHGLELLQYYLPGGRVIGREYVCASLAGGVGMSCKTRIDTGVGSDFASGDKWSDYASLIAQIERVQMHEAANIIEEFIGSKPYKPPVIVNETKEERAENGKRIAAETWAAAGPASQAHPYLARKKVHAAHDLRVSPAGELLIPLSGPDGEMRAVQRIDGNGGKRTTKDGQTSGSFYVITGSDRRIFIAEGYATAASVAEATGCLTVMAYSASNVPSVAAHFAEMFPKSDIIIAQDNDEAGRKSTEDARKLVPRIRAVAPTTHKDWNDVHVEAGIDSVRSALNINPDAILRDITTIPLTDPEFLIEDAIETPCTGTIIGAPGAGKSFFALDLAFHITTGKNWLGKHVKEGPVIYICGEGRHAIPRRMKAWEAKHGRTVPESTFFMAQRTVTFDDENVQQLVAEVDRLAEQSGSPRLVIIDTMARALPGTSDENSAKDIGIFVRAVDAVRDRYSCVVLVVHHTGWSESAQKRGRGSSAMKGAMDIELLMVDGTIEWAKTKDMEPHPTVSYTLEKFAYADGKRDNSCIVKYDTSYDPKEMKLTAIQKEGLEAFKSTIDALSVIKLTLSDWRDAFYRIHGGTESSNRQAFNRVKKDLIGLRLIHEEEGGSYVLGGQDKTAEHLDAMMFANLVKS